MASGKSRKRCLEEDESEDDSKKVATMPPKAVPIPAITATNYLSIKQERFHKLANKRCFAGSDDEEEGEEDEDEDDDGVATDSGEEEEGFAEIYTAEAESHRKFKEARLKDERIKLKKYEKLDEEGGKLITNTGDAEDEDDGSSLAEYDMQDGFMASDDDVKKGGQDEETEAEADGSNDSDSNTVVSDEEVDDGKGTFIQVVLDGVLREAQTRLVEIYTTAFKNILEAHPNLLRYYIQSLIVHPDVSLTEETRKRFEIARNSITLIMAKVVELIVGLVDEIVPDQKLNTYLRWKKVVVVVDEVGEGSRTGVPSAYFDAAMKCAETGFRIKTGEPRVVLLVDDGVVKLFHPVMYTFIKSLRVLQALPERLQSYITAVCEGTPAVKRTENWAEWIGLPEAGDLNVRYKACEAAVIKTVKTVVEWTYKALAVYQSKK